MNASPTRAARPPLPNGGNRVACTRVGVKNGRRDRLSRDRSRTGPADRSAAQTRPAGLVAAVIQDERTGEVLMVGWMDDVALHRTLTTGRSTFFSRSREEYWVKGETSGHRQWVREVRLDCDGDTLLVTVHQEGAGLSHRRPDLLRRPGAAGRGRSSRRARPVSAAHPSLEDFRDAGPRASGDRGAPAVPGRRRDRGRALLQARRRPARHLSARVGRAGGLVALLLHRRPGRRHLDRAATAQAVWTGHAPVGLPSDGDPLEAVRETLRLLHTPHADGSAARSPPGWSATSATTPYAGSSACPTATSNDLQVPELAFLLASDLAVLDHHAGEVWLIANAINFDGTDQRVDEAYADAVARLDAMAGPAGAADTVLGGLGHLRPGDPARSVGSGRPRSSRVLSAPRWKRSRPARRSRSWSASGSRSTPPPTRCDIYRVLRLTNPSPYMYLLRLDGFDIVGSSPEALVTVKGRTAITHPIAGSKPRGATPARGCRPRDRAARRPEGAGRARDAGRPRPQRPGPGLSSRARWRSSSSWTSAGTATSCTSNPR